MNNIELKLFLIAVKYIVKMNYAFHLVGMRITNGVIELRYDLDDEDHSYYFTIAKFDSQEEAEAWASDGRKTWRKIQQTIDYVVEDNSKKEEELISNIAFDVAEAVGAVDELPSKDYPFSLDEVIAYKNFVKKHFPGDEVMDEYYEALRIQQEWNDDVAKFKKELSDGLFPEHGYYGQCGPFKTIEFSDKGKALIKSGMDEYIQQNPQPEWSYLTPNEKREKRLAELAQAILATFN